MRLKCIRLAGFKSFVDPTTISFPSNVCAVVGPNGCGKSNVIDAVRWVMGESSPRNLRGEQMADVIFNGSASRNPVGLASVELVFDNSAGRLQGEYAGYVEVSVKRKVERDGDSTYSLNGTKCRRRDITELFLGTGLGPRSYSIVEQGMIGRLIESRPEELRVFIEEAAGISKYRERRKETATRIGKTRGNLERLADVRGELERQLQHLDRQAKAAQRYRELQQQQRATRACLLALRWRELARQIELAANALAGLQTRKEENLAGQRRQEAVIEQRREQNAQSNRKLAATQAKSVEIGNQAARIEQSIEHHRERVAQLEAELEKNRAEWQQTSTELDTDLARVAQIKRELEQISRELLAAEAGNQESARRVDKTEHEYQESMRLWGDFTLEAETPRQAAKVEQAKIRQLESNIDRARKVQQRLQDEFEELEGEPVDCSTLEREEASLEDELRELRRRQAEAVTALQKSRRLFEASSAELHRVRASIEETGGRKASLDALQQAALADDDASLAAWLERHGYDDNPKLGETLRVAPGWETAVELVLGERLRAICVEQLPDSLLQDLPKADLTLLEQGSPAAASEAKTAATLLASKANASGALAGLLGRVHVAESLADALARRSGLQPEESFITAEGVWIGATWVRIGKADEEDSVALRQALIENLRGTIGELEESQRSLGEQVEQFRQEQVRAEREREHCLERIQQKTTELNTVRGQIAAEQARSKSDVARRERIGAELDELEGQLRQDRASAEQASEHLREARHRIARDTNRQQEYEQHREKLRTRLESCRSQAARDKEACHALALHKNALDAECKSTRENMDRMAVQVQRAAKRIETIESQLKEMLLPGKELQQQLQEALQQHALAEQELRQVRSATEQAEAKLRSLEHALQESRKQNDAIVEEIGNQRVAGASLESDSRGLLAELDQLGLTPELVLDGLPEEHTPEFCEQKLEKLANRVQRLGAVNLAAAEESAELSERKGWLEKQHEELEKALTTLEQAMAKIDSETRGRFGAMLEQINAGLKGLFARLFGGGQARLELTGEDLLNAGVTIVARPPGKKNANIHLLSGGEKAMTAIALVFTIFQLNPAPFCMLDEVDAPLDDANINRFTALVRELADSVQFILVTHNKVSMETANQLLGVTMQEAGISRIVSVDIDEAAELATA